jgi:hypothetical protein
MPMLLLTAADRENLIKSETCIILPKMKHRIEIVWEKTDVDPGFANRITLGPNYSVNDLPLVSRVASPAAGVMSARIIIMIETPVVPPYPTILVAGTKSPIDDVCG